MQMTQQVGKDWFESAASFHFKTKRNELMQRRGMNVERTREPNEPNGAEPNRTERAQHELATKSCRRRRRL